MEKSLTSDAKSSEAKQEYPKSGGSKSYPGPGTVTKSGKSVKYASDSGKANDAKPA